MVHLNQIMFQLMFENLVHSAKGNITKVGSQLGCAALCRHPCKSVFYRDDSKLCLLSDVRHQESSVGLETEDNWGYYHALETHKCPIAGYTLLSSVKMCVKIVDAYKKNHADATTECSGDQNGHLVNLHTTAKINSVFTYLKTNNVRENIFIGLSDETYPKGEFHWTDGSLLTDSRWSDGNPDNNQGDNCVAMDVGGSYRWLDLWCSDLFCFICETPVYPNL